MQDNLKNELHANNLEQKLDLEKKIESEKRLAAEKIEQEVKSLDPKDLLDVSSSLKNNIERREN